MIPLKKKKWTEDEVNILQTLARNVASSIERIAGKQQFMKVKKIPFVSQYIPGAVYLSDNDEKFTKYISMMRLKS
jgi:hypothetical protein